MERTDTEYVEQASVVDPATVARNLSRYDLVLGVIPIALLSAAALGAVAPVSVELFLGAAGVLCLPVLFDALFWNPPTQSRPGTHEGEAVDRDGVDATIGGDVDATIGGDVDAIPGGNVDATIGGDVDSISGGDVDGSAR